MTAGQAASELELLERFIEVLQSKEPIPLPRQTVLGAISHYISSLSASDVKPLFKAINTSEYLWNTSSYRSATQEAITLGVKGAVDRLRSQPGSSRWWRRKSEVSVWLDEICEITIDLDGTNRLDVLVALLAGWEGGGAKTDANVWSGSARENLEDEIVMGIANQLADGGKSLQTPSRDTAMLCEALEVVDGAKIRILDTDRIQTALLSQLYTTLSDTPALSEAPTSSATLSRSISRLFTLLKEGDVASRQQAWTGMRQFSIDMRGVVARLPLLHPSEGHNEQDGSFAQHKSALFAYLLPSSAALSILLHSDPPPPLAKEDSIPITKAAIAAETLHTLSAFAAILDQSEGGLEGYHRVLHGMTDVLVASSGSAGVRDILSRAPTADTCSPAEGSWWLNFGESVIREVDQRSFETILEPMIQRFISDENHRSAFEAAHSLRLATIQAASQNMCSNTSRSHFESQVVHYSDLLLQQYTAGKLTNDQFRSAYPLLIESASKHSDQLVSTLLTQLRLARAPSTSPETFGQTRRMVLIASAPHIAPHRLRAYLDDLAREIMATPAASNARAELTGAAFRMVMHDLGDSARMAGMEWWTEWREKFEQGVGVSRGEAKL